MRCLQTIVHPDVSNREGNLFVRRAARGIVLRGTQILLLYTKRYNDYSFPGGGVDLNEDLMQGLVREMAEETGAQNVRNIREFGYIDEYRSYRKENYDLMRMLSYFYICEIDKDLKEAKLEDYEAANGMSPVWIEIDEAIRHNKKVMAEREPSMGISIGRETLVLELVAEELLA